MRWKNDDDFAVVVAEVVNEVDAVDEDAEDEEDSDDVEDEDDEANCDTNQRPQRCRNLFSF